jgi:pimeloyl-ACP methyl ester carboxylesterase
MALPGALMPVSMALPSTWPGRRMVGIGTPPSGRMTRRMLAAIGGDGSIAGVPDAPFDALGAAMALAAPSYATLDIRRSRTPHPHLQATASELAACRSPLLLLWGDEDKVQSHEADQRAARLLPHGRLEVLPGGHGLWFEHPQRCGHILSEFLQNRDQNWDQHATSDEGRPHQKWQTCAWCSRLLVPRDATAHGPTAADLRSEPKPGTPRQVCTSV